MERSDLSRLVYIAVFFSRYIYNDFNCWHAVIFLALLYYVNVLIGRALS